MSTLTLNPLCSGGRASGRRVTYELAARIVLAALALLLCYQFDWTFLRSLTLEWNLRLDALFGVHLQRISSDTVLWNGSTYRYVIACTFADVWCAALPLIWNVRTRVSENLLLLALFTPALLAFNIFRLSISDALVAAGLSWNVGHNVISGLSYFVIWEFVRRRMKQVKT